MTMLSMPAFARGKSTGSDAPSMLSLARARSSDSTRRPVTQSDSGCSTGNKKRSSSGSKSPTRSGSKSPTRSGSKSPTRSGSKSPTRSGSRSPIRKQFSFKKERSLKKTKGFNEELSMCLKEAIDSSPILSASPQSFLRYYGVNEVRKGGKFQAGDFYDILNIKYLPSNDGDLLDDSESLSGDPYAADPEGDSDLKSQNESIKRVYVLKQISQKHSREQQIMQQATMRLVLEAKYLARLNHPNIVQARGLPTGEEGPLLNGGASGFFIVMESYVETLEQRLERWKRESPEDHVFDPSSRNVQRKLRYAMALADALQYLHDRNLVVLNLRPETIGFLEDGTIQIRDLCCCREVTESNGSEDGPLGFDCDLQLEEDANSQMAAAKSNFLVLEASVDGKPRPRYVAPEAIMDHKYTSAADTYSWAHVFFELLTLSKPYPQYKLGQLLTKVCLDGSRPNLSVYKFPKQLESLLQLSWRKMYSGRPSMKALLEAIPILMKLSDRVVATPQA